MLKWFWNSNSKVLWSLACLLIESALRVSYLAYKLKPKEFWPWYPGVLQNIMLFAELRWKIYETQLSKYFEQQIWTYVVFSDTTQSRSLVTTNSLLKYLRLLLIFQHKSQIYDMNYLQLFLSHSLLTYPIKILSIEGIKFEKKKKVLYSFSIDDLETKD